jgi:LPXTG-motif cell wall-anchored protein
VKTYTITATNVCGGSDSSTASVHLNGAIEPEVAEVKPPELPQTASPLPLITLLGFGSLVSGLILRAMRKN